MTKAKTTSRKSNALVFTHTRSTEMEWIYHPERSENPELLPSHHGTYSCIVEDGKCVNVQDMMRTHHGAFANLDLRTFMNLNFFASKKNKEDSQSQSSSDQIEEVNDDGNDYMYGSAVYDLSGYYKHQVYSWEIMRANLNNDGDREPSVETYFKTVREFDWNQCEFDCCPFNDEPDSNGFVAHRDRHDWAYMHAYVRTIPRDFAVDKNTGQIFISWEGFYKNCDPAAHFSVEPIMEWTIGVSRLKTEAEDPSCILAKDEDGNPKGLELNFGRCTVPVSVVAMEKHGRDLQLAHGGLTVIPAAKEPPAPGLKPRRTFLLSVLEPSKGTHLWAMPENGDATENRYMRQQLSTTPVGRHMFELGIWNGGNIRVHYNEETGRPDHVCRTVFDQGIRCMPIEVTEDAQSTYVTVTGDEETFLTEEQVHEFCVTSNDASSSTLKEPNFEDRTTLVSGLDVVWNEEDGTPERIFFGCSGYKSIGNLGSVEKGGANLIDAVPGAHAGDVVFLPRELELSTVRTPLTSELPTTKGRFSSLNKIPAGDFYGVAVAAALLVIGIALHTFYKKRFWSPFRAAYPTSNDRDYAGRSRGLPVTYMELSCMENSSSGSTDDSSFEE